MRRSIMLLLATACLTVVYAFPATAQQRGAQTRPTDDDDEVRPPVVQPQRSYADTNTVGRAARGATGIVGQRQTREVAAEEAGIVPTARIANRLQTRVQSRIRSRIDRGYAPQQDATDAVAAAQEQTRTTPRSR